MKTGAVNVDESPELPKKYEESKETTRKDGEGRRGEPYREGSDEVHLDSLIQCIYCRKMFHYEVFLLHQQMCPE